MRWYRIAYLEVQVVLAFTVELGRGNIHGDLDLAGVTSLLDGIGDEVKGLLGGLDIGSDTTLVSDIAGGLSIPLLGQGLENLVHLGTLTHSFREGRGGAGDDHELLEGKATTSVGSYSTMNQQPEKNGASEAWRRKRLTSVNDVHERNRENIGLLGTRKVRDVSVEGDALENRAKEVMS